MGFFGSDTKDTIANPKDNLEIRNKIIKSFIDSDGKFRKPFEKGDISGFNIMGGDWNGYANLVLTSVMADSLHSIESKMDEMITLEKEKLEVSLVRASSRFVTLASLISLAVNTFTGMGLSTIRRCVPVPVTTTWFKLL